MNLELFSVPGPWQGRLAIVMRPRGGDWLEAEVSEWHRARLDVVVSLLEQHEVDQFELSQEGEVAESRNIHFVSFPIPDRGVPASTKTALSFLHRITTKLDEGKNVAIHCRQSVGRSGLVAAGLLITSGMSVDQGVDLVSSARGQGIPETELQLHWIKHLPAEQLAPAP